MKNLFKVLQVALVCLVFTFFTSSTVEAQWSTNTAPSPDVVYVSTTGNNVCIGGTTMQYSWSKLDVKGSISSSGLDCYSSGTSGWATQVRFNNTSTGLRHVIADDQTNDRLVIYPGYGGGANAELQISGKTAIGTGNYPTSIGGANISAYKLFVKGGILTDELRVRTGWADYVFQESYVLKSLPEVESFIAANGHLPNVPSAEQIENQGLNVGEIAVNQQEKIEELFLYVIELDKKVKVLERENEKLTELIEKK